MRTASVVLSATLALFIANEAHADAELAASPSAPAASFLDALPPAPPPLPPAPDRETAERARRNWEVVPTVGWTMPSCRPASSGGSVCQGTGAGMNAGIGGVYRITPYVGLGAEVSAAEFRFDAVAAGASSGASRAGSIGPIFRGYFLERGGVDPWVQVGFGIGLVQSRFDGLAADVDARATGASVSGGAGVDFWISDSVKLGPALSQHLVFPSEVRVCQKGDCASYTVREAGGVTRWLRLGVVATFAFGEEM